jgi:hypothetical protein
MMVAPSVTEAMVTAMPLQLEAMLKQLEAVMAMVAPSVTEAETPEPQLVELGAEVSPAALTADEPTVVLTAEELAAEELTAEL